MFGPETTTNEVLRDVDLSGRHAVVTGASTGLGEETVRALAAHGASVTLAVRDLDRGRAALERIRSALGSDADLELLQVDLGSLSSVRAAAANLLDQHPRLHLLVNNAGIMACPYGTTVDGFELQFGTNHLGHFLFATLLTPALVAGAPARLVSLSSRGHSYADVDLDDPGFEHTTYDPFVAYGRSKTANALFAVEFDRRHAADGVRAFSVHPGGIHTELGRYMTPEVIETLLTQLRSAPARITWKTVPQGAATSVWAATAPELDTHGGAYLEDCGVAQVDDAPDAQNGVRSYAVDPDRAQALWVLSERLVAGC
jgi:NAD(P)-dependent dehydrogenase (short-subunit alcohol dehydrogenase family)